MSKGIKKNMKRQTRSQAVAHGLQQQTTSKNADGDATMDRTDASVVQAKLTKDTQKIQADGKKRGRLPKEKGTNVSTSKVLFKDIKKIQADVKKRGRPRKVKNCDGSSSEAEFAAKDMQKKRGRPRKEKDSDGSSSEAEFAAKDMQKKRGRPRKEKDSDGSSSEAEFAAKDIKKIQTDVKKRGRPRKVKDSDGSSSEAEFAAKDIKKIQADVKKRGRPRKVKDSDGSSSEAEFAAKDMQKKRGKPREKKDSDGSASEEEVTAKDIKKKIGKPREGKNIGESPAESEIPAKSIQNVQAEVKSGRPHKQKDADEGALVFQAKAIQTEQAEVKKMANRRKQTYTDKTASELNASAKNFTKHWYIIDQLFNGLTDSGNDSMGPTISSDTIDSISKWSVKAGLGDNQFKVIWTLVSDQRSTLNEELKIALVNLLIPIEKCHEDNIRAILKWLFKGSKTVGAKLVNAVLKMLYGWTLYDLVDPKLFNNPVAYTNFVYLCKQRVEILPWLSILIRRITTAKFIFQEHIDVLYAITGKRIINDTITNCATELLHYYQYLRPDCFPCDPSYLKWAGRNFNDEQYNLSVDLRLALYEAKKRISKEAVVDVSEISDDGIKRQSIEIVLKMNQQFFEEFGPSTTVDININSLHLLNRWEAMLIMLRKEETLPLLALDKETLEHFNIWATMIFFHRFPHYQTKDHEKCIFVLERCLQLSLFLDDSLPAVTEWLIKFLPTWDGNLFENEVRELLRFMPLHIFAAKCGNFFKKLKMDFAKGSTLTRLQIWDILNKIIVRWPEVVKGKCPMTNANLDDEIKEAAEMFFKEIHSLIKKFVAAGGHQDFLVLRVIIETYQKIIETYSDDMIPIKPTVPEELAQMMILCDKIEILESCSKLYETFCSITKRTQYSKSGVFKREMFLYFQIKEKSFGSAPLMTLFKPEYEVLAKKENMGEPEKGTVDFKGIMQQLTCYYSDALRDFRIDPSQPFPINFGEDVFLWKELKKRAPFVYRQIGSHRPPRGMKPSNSTIGVQEQ